MLSEILSEMNIDISEYLDGDLAVFSPIDGGKIASVKTDSKNDLDSKILNSQISFEQWQDVPAPKRGELIRIFGQILRKVKKPLGKLVTLECGKILAEGEGEVQEMIDICDYAVGLSRMIGGLTLPSERPDHIMQENWLPLGPVGVISAFNFPVAVWAWNFSLAIICGNSVIWKPSEKTPITALVCHKLFERAVSRYKGEVPEWLSQITIGQRNIGEQMVDDNRIRLISATGSCAMGKQVASRAANRLARTLLELGGNNAAIITPSADMKVVLPSILFGAVGTAGQRCTSTRRVFVHESIKDKFFKSLKDAYKNLDGKVGDPFMQSSLIGPLIDKDSFKNMQKTVKILSKHCVEYVGGDRLLQSECPDAYYVNPVLALMNEQIDIVKQETFAPILYVMPYTNLEDAMKLHNDVAQGLSSAIFTSEIKEAEYFKKYSDCGIANVNIGTSGAEIGGAFGGEKETGGGRESGSDSWKIYMRRQTSTSYIGQEAPALAQGIKFKI
ncbi:aldehyde dehydrogenase family protein [Rickettsiales bacterium]|nr:aldehyde dehydrogenase family protein [Rickettsiales bacterium]